VYYNKIMELPESERAAFVKAKRDESAQHVDVFKRLTYAESKAHEFPPRRNGVSPV
jgi:hypothetical protein